jgi:hypothetical protein
MSFAVHFIFRRPAVYFLLALLAVLPASPLLGQDKPDDVIRVDTDLVQTNVVVVDKNGRFVEGLKQDQFVLKIDGKAAGRIGAAGEQDIYYNPKNPLAPGVYQVKVAVQDIQSGNKGFVAQWIEVPDLSRQQLTLSSLFLGGKVIGASGDSGSGQVQYSVDHRFSKPVTLDFTSFIYNAARAPAAAARPIWRRGLRCSTTTDKPSSTALCSR